MKILLTVCAGIAVASSIVSVTLWQQLRDAKADNEQLRSQLVRTISDFRASATVPAAAPAAPAPAEAPKEPATPAASAPAPEPPRPPTPSVAKLLEDSRNLQQDLMKNPEYRKLRLATQRASIANTYPGLVEELGLNDKEADKLFDLLTEHQMKMTDEMSLLSSGRNTDPATVQEQMKRQQELQRAQEESVRTLLGSKYPQWQEYQTTRPARMQATSYGSQMAQAGMPLTPTQTKSLTQVLIAEQERQRQSALSAARSSAINPADPEAVRKRMEESLQRNEESSRRMLDAVAPHLNEKQLALLREQQERSVAMTRMAMQAQMERQQSQTQGQSPQILILP